MKQTILKKLSIIAVSGALTLSMSSFIFASPATQLSKSAFCHRSVCSTNVGYCISGTVRHHRYVQNNVVENNVAPSNVVENNVVESNVAQNNVIETAPVQNTVVCPNYEQNSGHHSYGGHHSGWGGHHHR